MSELLPKISLVGRPNVGKSTLFNRLVRRRQAIVDDIPGVTRDRQYGEVHTADGIFQLIDTGGFVPHAEVDALAVPVREQVELALEESQAVLLVVDGKAGLHPADQEIARLLRKRALPVVLVVNKVDNPSDRGRLAEFFALGLDSIVGVSAESGLGIEELLNCLMSWMVSPEAIIHKKSDLQLAIFGQPNVGKSTLLNALLGETRAVVHDQGGTTLDPLRIQMERGSQVIELVDTAGIRRRKSTSGKIEKVSVLKALEAVRRADLVLWVVDSPLGLSRQDIRLLKEAEAAGRGIILVLNKWDLMPSGATLKAFKEKWLDIRARLDYVPLVALSAKTGRGVKKLFLQIDKLYENYLRRISTGELNRVFQKAVQEHPHSSPGGRAVSFFYVTQTHEGPPRFIIFCNRPELVAESYLRYLERIFRKNFDFAGVPFRWSLRSKQD